MNHDIDDIPTFDDPAQEREWLAQENAMRRERLQLDPAGDDARSGRYRLLARALRTDEPDGLPANFAQQTSALALMSAHSPAPTSNLERVLAITLAALLVLTAVAATFIYGASWWPSFKVLLPAPAAMQWVLALAGCLGLSWVMGAGSRWMSSTQ